MVVWKGCATSAAVVFTHIFSPFKQSPGSQGLIEVTLAQQSWINAAQRFEQDQRQSNNQEVCIEFLAAVLSDDLSAVPDWATPATPLEYYALNSRGHKLPTIGEIWKRGVEEGKGRYLVYTNLDIGLQGDFYSKALALLTTAEEEREKRIQASEVTASSEPEIALEFTRVQVMKLQPGVTEPPPLEEVLSYPQVARHPGHDCFVVPRHAVPPTLTTGGLVVGMPPWGTMYHLELAKSANLRLLFLRGTPTERYTFHSGFAGTDESWMENQDFRLQQYAEAFRVFGPELVTHAFGAKGKSSPFYYLCNSTKRQFPVCDFCDAFYPLSMYPDFVSAKGHRDCMGLITDRISFQQLPTPVTTERSDLSKYARLEFSTLSNHSHSRVGPPPPSFLAHPQHCKVKCQAMRNKCRKGVVRGPVRPVERSRKDLRQFTDNSRSSSSHSLPALPTVVQPDRTEAGTGTAVGGSLGLSDTSQLINLAHPRPPMLWGFPGSDTIFMRLVLEFAAGKFSSALVEDVNSPVAFKHPKNSRAAPQCSDNSSLLVQVPVEQSLGSTKAPLVNRWSPSCLHLLPFQAAIAVVRDPFTCAWAEFHRQWVVAHASSATEEGERGAARLVFNFMTDEDIDGFSRKVVKLAQAWRVAHDELLRYNDTVPNAVRFVKHETVVEGMSTGYAGIFQVSREAITELRRALSFLGIKHVTSERVECAVLQASRALPHKLSPQQEATSQDQLYDGATVCKMWSIVHAPATRLGYDTPFGNMPCTVKDTPAEKSPCGWFDWALSASSLTLQQWVASCSPE